ncbi:NAD(P)/FAD-dependent oxidoreductase [Cyanobium sp. NIES-981]|uniref:NAD(P)/FAD-dependent oxidoreductase n=1 Tax=Cyanobium sp. NIES-981 TaxID=1851505 RepID=UPI0007DD4DAC|nr:FAD-dependent oxidoreductase [Cyanobium sp. NIES-981]SBO43845.1 putative enzyme [Cyanobium sp. NIES-981]
MPTQRILVLGGGFAGLWSALGAARQLRQLGIGPETARVSLVNRDAFHAIRVRNYEPDLRGLRVPLDELLPPVGVERIKAEVVGLDPAAHTVAVATATGRDHLPYDRLVVALGSQVVKPPLKGLAEHGFDVDTYGAALRLERHLRSLPRRPAADGRFTVVVVGAGLTGIEVAAEMPARLQALIQKSPAAQPARVLLLDHSPRLGSDMGDGARPWIAAALAALGVETRLGVEVAAIDPSGLLLAGGERIAAATVVWCAGMRANPLTGCLPVQRDNLGRLPVDAFLRVEGVEHVFAAGDAARAPLDPPHTSVPSCQHARPMGRFAGHNAVCDLFDKPMLPLHIPWYVTVLDLGSQGALYTEGWDRQVVASGEAAKRTKMLINRQRIYPPRSGRPDDLLAAAAPEVQPPPARQGKECDGQ